MAARLTLVIGTKRFSSWSLRAWLALKMAGLAFDEIEIRLRQTDTRANILKHSPSGRVPLLKDGELLVWESLAICEYIADLACAVPMWPENRAARALARAVATEMHSGFMPLRQHLPMDVAQKIAPTAEALTAATDDIARIQEIWSDCRARYGSGGPFLFGRFSMADAMYAPVATRFDTYDVALNPTCAAYVAAIMALPAMQDWIEAAKIGEPV